MIRTVRCQLFGVYSLLALGAASASSAAPFNNGSFESPALPSPSRVAISNLNDWTGVGGFMQLERGINGTSGLAADDGDQFVSFGHSGDSGDRLFQSFDTVVGQLYSVDYMVTAIQGGSSPPAQSLRATAFDDTTNAPLGFVDNVITMNNNWVAGTPLVFMATSSTSRLEFEHTVAAGAANVALDHVRVIPEPAAVGLMATAIGLGLWRCRRSTT